MLSYRRSRQCKSVSLMIRCGLIPVIVVGFALRNQKTRAFSPCIPTPWLPGFNAEFKLMYKTLPETPYSPALGDVAVPAVLRTLVYAATEVLM